MPYPLFALYYLFVFDVFTYLHAPSMQNQFSYHDPSFSMEDMLATLPRVVSVPPVSGSCLPPQDLASGGQIAGGFSRGNQDDPRCNGTLRKQASPRTSSLGVGSVLTVGQGKAECSPTKICFDSGLNPLFTQKCCTENALRRITSF